MGERPFLITFRGDAGPTWIRRAVELDPYDVNYHGVDLHLGVENGESFPLLGFLPIPEWVARMNVFGEVGYGYTGGDEKNLGSHRHQLLFRGGLRTRLFDWVALDASAAIGGAINRLNFGKGFPPPTEFTVNGHLGASVGFQLCLGRDLCITPYVAFDYERSLIDPLYEARIIRGGILIGGNPHYDGMPEEDIPPEPADDCPPGTCPEIDPLLPVTTPREVVVVKEAPTTEKVLSLPDAILYANDNPDLPLQPQWFKGMTGRLFECFSHPELDHLIRTARHWAEKLRDRQQAGLTDTYTFTIRVKGYANDTGSSEGNRLLGLYRAQGVVDYLTHDGTGHVSHMKDAFPRKYVQRRADLLRTSSVDLDKISLRQTCGAQDHEGRYRWTLHDLLSPTGPFTIINENRTSGKDPRQEIIDDFGSAISPENPALRRTRIQIDVVKNGVPLSFEESRAFMAELGVE